ncbi:MAG: cytochrome-c oxidase, cbb3-type subunit II [Gammaproteobacteria bacterium]|jgi:cytochrome c oxidase cbb3-type subunit 2|nr:MAG: cytochrome-c oxidase, cbb3-type subunit II [Gammaproteobacteria bacterium]
MKHDALEKNVGLLMALILVCVSIGGMVQIFPLIFEGSLSKPIDTLKPLTAVQLEGRDIYMREGCAVCHTQMVRPLQHETARYGHYSVAGEDAYEHPFLWGSKRTGPDLARVGGRYSDAWHVAHLMDPRSVVPVSNMPAYPWLFENVLDGADTAAKMKTLRTLGVPYTDADIEGAQAAVQGTSEAEALIAYLQNLGLDMRGYGQ